MSKEVNFSAAFKQLTGHVPMPWQESLYKEWLCQGIFPDSCDIPTGLGKTSVIAIWLLARLFHPEQVPRRLVYVVNRHTVVDQTTSEVENYRNRIKSLDAQASLRILVDSLGVSTLRGQFADNAEWSADPSKPAVICGTVDMIGSRLLFEGYRIGFKSRPLHAGFLGQDSLLVHDEAHLEPAFQKLIEIIRAEQTKERDRNGNLPWSGLRVMAMSATARGNREKAKAGIREPFGLTDKEKNPPDDIPDPPSEPIHLVWLRLKAKKSLYFHPSDNDNKLAEQIADLATQHDDKKAAVLIFVRRVEDVDKVVKVLTDKKKRGVPTDHVKTLTGTMRGYERDEVVKSNAVFARFLPESDRPEGLQPAEGTVYLVCTSAGEVGVNLSADHMVCDLSTFDSMAQRLGRVNRFGDRNDTRVDVVHPKEFGKKDKSGKVSKTKVDERREKTLALLIELNGDASPKALGDLPPDERLAAYAPKPTILPATDILFDAWAMTSIKGKMPGRPPVGPYLHGVADWEPPRTSVAWRQEIEFITKDLIQGEDDGFLDELLSDYPLKPHEMLTDITERILKSLQALSEKHPDAPIWLIEESSVVQVTTLGKLNAGDKKQVVARLADGIVLLPPCVGGLSSGMLDGISEHADDVSDQWLQEDSQPRRIRVWDDAPAPTYVDKEGKTRPMALVRTIDITPDAEELELDEMGNGSSDRRYWHWFVRPRDADNASRASTRPIKWQHHTNDVVKRTTEIVEALDLSDDLKQAINLAAQLHDLGKKRELWQRSIGNPNPTDWHAKPGKPADGPRWRPRHLSDYRHEFGSLLDALHSDGELATKLTELSEEMQDVVLHLIAAHHGRARPHFAPTEMIDPEHTSALGESESVEVMRRYARLQRKYGRWGLAYLESLLRAADWDASANPSPQGGDQE